MVPKQTQGNFKRILLKISGEGLMGGRQHGLDPDTVARVTQEIALASKSNIEICLVIGGGNIFRGVSSAAKGIERTTADHMGMLATVINALAVQAALENLGVDTRVLSAIPMQNICESYIRRRAMRHLEKGRVVIFAAGTGNPYFTTDMAAALRASEMECDAVLKATQVDGVYDRDPKLYPDAVRYECLNYDDVLAQHLAVMDFSAITLCRDSNLPIVVFSMHDSGGLKGVFDGNGYSTVIAQTETRFSR